jgi:hypothetical protein
MWEYPGEQFAVSMGEEIDLLPPLPKRFAVNDNSQAAEKAAWCQRRERISGECESIRLPDTEYAIQLHFCSDKTARLNAAIGWAMPRVLHEFK